MMTAKQLCSVLAVLLLLCSQLSIVDSFKPISSVHGIARSSVGLARSARGYRFSLSAGATEQDFDTVKTALKEKLKPFAKGQLAVMLKGFIDEYAESAFQAKITPAQFEENLSQFFKSVAENTKTPHQFETFHKAVRAPFDYYAWGNTFLKPMVITEKSKVFGEKNIKAVEDVLKKGENVILFSNHQTEADPQVISILLESIGKGDLAEKIIFLAGHKVTTDPIAIPFSMGRNLLCIHSRKHIKNPPELFAKKLAQNLDSIKALTQLMDEGGNVFWLAPSGGRDRPDESGKFAIAEFHAKSIELFRLLTAKATKKTHYFPMAMFTHQLVPPPKTVSSDLGEERSAKRGAVSISFIPEADGSIESYEKLTQNMQDSVTRAYSEMENWHNNNQQ